MTERQRLQRNAASDKWKRNNPEKFKASSRRRYLKRTEAIVTRRNIRNCHKVDRATSHRNWVARNRAHRLKYMVEYNAKRKDAQKEYDRLRHLRPENVAKRQRLKESKKIYMKSWMQKNRDKHRLAYAKRRAQKRGNGIGDSKAISAWIRSWQSLKHVMCYWCREMSATKDCHCDHIIALKNGGAHALENLCISCGDCNRRKHDKPLSIWNQQISEPVLL